MPDCTEIPIPSNLMEQLAEDLENLRDAFVRLELSLRDIQLAVEGSSDAVTQQVHDVLRRFALPRSDTDSSPTNRGPSSTAQ